MKTIGILGDGQLARLLALSKVGRQFQFVFLGENPYGPCYGLGRFIRGSLNDTDKIKELARLCDIVTFENEFIKIENLDPIRDKLLPNFAVFKKLATKALEKKLASKASVPVGEYQVYKNYQGEDLSIPSMVKLSFGGYDGFGNFFIKSKSDLNKVKDQLVGREIICEKVLDFEREVAVTVARNTNGDVISFPVVDTIQKDFKCDRVLFPSSLNLNLQHKIQQYALKITKNLEYVGVLSFEFFVMKNGDVFYNELSPRPHNSAHYTLDTFQYSQFDYHLLALSGQRLPKPIRKYDSAVMFNLLGNDQQKKRVPEISGVHIYDYQKEQSRKGRKMGHATIVGNDPLEKILKVSYKVEKGIQL